MYRDFTDLLADPLTGEPLRLTVAREHHGRVLAGTLDSSTGRYPIVDGIPRFVDAPAADRRAARSYTDSFGYQWTTWPRLQFEGENTGTRMAGYTRGMWEAVTGMTARLADRVVLDVGCGSGRFVDVARAKGARVIGVDASAAVEAAARSFAEDPGVCIVQGDALHLPIRSAAVDGAFSIGVLHHTPDPAHGVREAARVLAPGGWLAISVYTKGGFYDTPVVHAWRRLFRRLWRYAGHRPPLAYAYSVVYTTRLLRPVPVVGRLAGAALGRCCPSKDLPDRQWALLDTFDAVTPQYQSAHECHEVFAWLRRAGLIDIEPTPHGPTSFRGWKARA